MSDVFTLTKLNYNTCIYSDGVPVTLKFADMIGEILTAGPIQNDLPPLPFRYYIQLMKIQLVCGGSEVAESHSRQTDSGL